MVKLNISSFIKWRPVHVHVHVFVPSIIMLLIMFVFVSTFMFILKQELHVDVSHHGEKMADIRTPKNYLPKLTLSKVNGVNLSK